MVIFVTKNPEAYDYVDWSAEGIQVEDNLESLGEYCDSLEVVDFDLETTGFKPWTNAPLLTVLGNKQKQYVVDNTEANGWPLVEIMEEFNVGEKILRGANIKFDLLFWLYNNLGATDPKGVYDVMIAEQTLVKGFDKISCSLDNIAQRRLGVPPLAKAVRNEFPLMSSRRAHFYPRHILYAAEDCEHLEDIEKQQRKFGEKLGLDLNFKINMYSTLAIAKLEARGILIDQALWTENALNQERKMMDAEKYLDRMLQDGGLALRERNTQVTSQGDLFGEAKPVKSKNPQIINYNSNKQLQEAFERLGWTLPLNTSTGKASFASEVLADYRVRFFGTPASEFCLKFKDYKESLKASTTYGLDFLKKVNPQTGAIHCEYNVNRTTTGRFSCQNPNMQQIPGKKSYRDCFIARPGFSIMTADYSSAELRILADFSGDKKMIDILDTGGDLHSYVAMEVFRVLNDEPELIISKDENPELRNKIKAVIFSKVYGASVKKTAELLDCPMEDAERAEDLMREALPEAFAFLDKVSDQALEQGYIEFNKLVRTRRYFPACYDGRRLIDIRGDKFLSGSVGRAAKNAPIQGCLPYETTIQVEDLGEVPIGSQLGKLIKVWDGEDYSEGLVVHSGLKTQIKIELTSGHVLKCSPNHPILTVDPKGIRTYINAEDLVKMSNNRRVVVSSGIVERIQSQSENFGELWGSLASDCSLSKTGNIRWIVAEHEEDKLEYIKGLASLLGRPVRVKTLDRKNRNQRLFHVEINSREIYEYFKKSGIKKRVPKECFTSSVLMRGYMKFLFDGDGTVNSDTAAINLGKQEHKYEFLLSVQRGLQTLGINSRVKRYKNSNKLTILKREMYLFKSLIGFVGENKKEKLNSLNFEKPLKDPSYGRFAFPIKSYEVAEEQVEMYDILDTKNQRFVANGVVVHNSNGDMMKLAIARIYLFLKKNRLSDKVFLLLQVHDEVVLEIAEGYENVAPKIIDILNQAANDFFTRIKMKTEYKILDKWAK